MKVKAESCFNGHGFEVRLTLPNGVRLVMPMPEEAWCRSVAIRAKNLVQAETGASRKSIRFT